MFGAVLPTVLPGARYEVFDLAPADLELFVRTAPDAGIAGFNVTIPHKVAVLPFLDLLDKTAAAVGAVNCVEVRPDGRFIGHNTDAPAFEACIRSLAPPLGSSASPIRSALILGGGGAARAVVHALRELGVPLIVLAERRSGDHRPRRAPSGVEGNILRASSPPSPAFPLLPRPWRPRPPTSPLSSTAPPSAWPPTSRLPLSKRASVRVRSSSTSSTALVPPACSG